MAHFQHRPGTTGARCIADASIDGVPVRAVVIQPDQPTRRSSPDLSAYHRLDPKPQPESRPRPNGYRHVRSDGADALAYALAGLEAQVKARCEPSSDAFTWSVDLGAFSRGAGPVWPR